MSEKEDRLHYVKTGDNVYEGLFPISSSHVYPTSTSAPKVPPHEGLGPIDTDMTDPFRMMNIGP